MKRHINHGLAGLGIKRALLVASLLFLLVVPNSLTSTRASGVTTGPAIVSASAGVNAGTNAGTQTPVPATPAPTATVSASGGGVNTGSILRTSITRSQTTGATSGSVTVPANVGWVNTGINLNAGDQLTIAASGSWTPGLPATGTVGPNGSTKPWPDNYFDLQDIGCGFFCASTPAPHWAALIAYIGSAPPGPSSYASSSTLPEAKKVFLVGSSYK